MHSNRVRTGPNQDLDNLLSFLDRAEEIATSTSSAFMAKENDYESWDAFSRIEPTPIQPDLEITKQDSFIINNQKQLSHPDPIQTDQFCASEGKCLSNVNSNMDDAPLDLEEAIFPHMIAERLSEDSSSTSDKCPPVTSHSTEHGHLPVPHSYPPNQKLAQWVKRQRHQHKRKHMGHHSTLTDDREEKLLAVGFIFDSHRAAWYERFETLKAFFLAHGHCKIPAKFEDGSLNVWIKHQRRQYVVFMNGEKSTMSVERIAALNSIRFDWNPRKLLRLKTLYD
ncbi:helicase domain protein [Nitzschia inconspicua]|uniref:Helicase domain protein n=1 Tax=Nitzschia inconspicua TaxID=303405 RepID=A0A9K3PCQ2_9STRA|nr:helicase domain protein [Nitzschia inconspicua]